MTAAPRRSLIMAGGGTKVAFQAGVLQVWLDEAGIAFDHADGASGGVFNLAMWCQGLSGTQIADNWRNYRPLAGVQPSLHPLRSLFALDRFRRNVIGAWGLSWPTIRATPREATFNLFNFTEQRQEVVVAADMTEDKLISAVSLPMWFPPVEIDGDTYVDAVMATDANVEEAIRRGADELWIIWTVSTRGEWHNGFIAQYFQMIEAMANGQLRAILRRIDANNEAIRQGLHAEFGRHIETKMLEAEVPLHYLMNFTRDRMAAAVELGVAAARTWCAERSIPLTSPPERPHNPDPTSVWFTEEMTGHITVGATQPEDGSRFGRSVQRSECTFHLTITVDDLDWFTADPQHVAGAVGWIHCDALGGRRPVERGVFNLFVDQADPDDKRMRYQLWFRDGVGRPLTLAGHKVIHNERGLDLWRDTTTLYTRVLDGHVELADMPAATVVAAGILRIRPLMFARQMTTFRASAPTLAGRARGMVRFGRLFAGSLWDVYLTPALSSSPF